MNIEYLKLFYDVAAYRSISKAASESHISQSALSQQLSNMEVKLGVTLFERSNKGVELTPEGKTLLQHIEVILDSYDRMLEDMDSFKRDKTLIVIDSYYNLTNCSLSPVLYSSKKRFPQYQLKLNNTFLENIEINLLNHVSDIGISFIKSDNSDIINYKIMDDNLIMVASNSFMCPDSITIEDLVNYPLILIKDRMFIKKKLDMALNSYNKSASDLNILYTVNCLATALDSALKGYGLTIVPRLAVTDSLLKGSLKEITIKDFNLNYGVYLLYTHENYKVIRSFIDHFRRECKKNFYEL